MAKTWFSTPTETRNRSAERHRVTLRARLTWKDTRGAVRFTSVTTRDVSDVGIFVDAESGAAIPLYRIVHVQLERDAREIEGVPEPLRRGRVLSAIWRVAPCRPSTGTPAGYALRFLVDPHQNACAGTSDVRMAVAS